MKENPIIFFSGNPHVELKYLEDGTINFWSDDINISNNYNQISVEYKKLELRLLKQKDFYSKEEIREEKERVLRLVCANKPVEARKIIDELSSALNTFEINKTIYYGTSMAIFLISTFLVFKFKYSLIHLFNTTKIGADNISYVIIFGLLGSLFSILINSYTAYCKGQKPLSFIMNSLIRFTIGTISSIIVYFAIKSKMIFANIDTDNKYFLYFIVILAGYSESLILNIISKKEKEYSN